MKFNTILFTAVPGDEFGKGDTRHVVAQSLRNRQKNPGPAADSRAEFHALVKPNGGTIAALMTLIDKTDPRQLHAIGGTIADLIDLEYDFTRGVQVERRMYDSGAPYQDEDELIAIEFGLDAGGNAKAILIRFTNVE